MSVEDQVPVNSCIAATTAAIDVLGNIDLSGKTAIVTGGYSGIVLEVVRALAARGAKVIVPVRSAAKAAESLAGVNGDIRTEAMDLADLASVRQFAERVGADLASLDMLINNAGIMACPETRVGPGWEAQFGVNHMGHFALTKALMPLLVKASAARVVALSSTGHKISDVLWDDMEFRITP